MNDFEHNSKKKTSTNTNQESQLSSLQEKSTSAFHKINHYLQKMIQIYDDAEKELEIGTTTGEVIEQLNKQLISIKPFRAVKDIFIHFYKRLSSFVKQIQKKDQGKWEFRIDLKTYLDELIREGKQFQILCKSALKQRSFWIDEDSPSMKKKSQYLKVYNYFGEFISAEELQIMQLMLCEHFLRKGSWQCAKVFERQERNHQKIKNCKAIYEECFSIKNKILDGNYNEAIKWCESQNLYETYNDCLEYKFHQMEVLSLIKKQHCNEALFYCKKFMKKFYKFNHEDMSLLIGLILFSSNEFWKKQVSMSYQIIEEDEEKERQTKILSDNLTKRYAIFQNNERNNQYLAESFVKRYLKRAEISEFDSIDILFQTSQIAIKQFVKMNHFFEEDKKVKKHEEQQIRTLPFSIKLKNQYNYHSLFLCPVNKQLLSNKEAVVLLSCGHLISEAASNRILHQNRGRKKYKCPVCQKEIKVDQNKAVQF